MVVETNQNGLLLRNKEIRFLRYCVLEWSKKKMNEEVGSTPLLDDGYENHTVEYYFIVS